MSSPTPGPGPAQDPQDSQHQPESIVQTGRLSGLGVLCCSQPQTCATFAGTLPACLIFHPNPTDKNNKAALTFHINCLLYCFHGYLYFFSHQFCSLGRWQIWRQDPSSTTLHQLALCCWLLAGAAGADFFFFTANPCAGNSGEALTPTWHARDEKVVENCSNWISWFIKWCWTAFPSTFRFHTGVSHLIFL